MPKPKNDQTHHKGRKLYQQAAGTSWRILGVEGQNDMILELVSEFGMIRHPMERGLMNNILLLYAIQVVNRKQEPAEGKEG